MRWLSLILTVLVGIARLYSLTMLKLTTKSSYGLRACLTLAKAAGRLSSSEIASTDEIPQRYLEQILSALRQGGLVESVRGAKGGYSLRRAPSEITVSDLVEAVEGELPPMLCTNPSMRSDTCRKDSDCDCRGLCSELEYSVARVLKGTTLADILNGQHGLKTIITGDVHGSELSQKVLSTTSRQEK